MPSEPHAISRARERYGIILTIADLACLAMRCRKREGHVETQENGRQRHMIIWQERVLWVIWQPPPAGATSAHWGAVVTVLPVAAAADTAWRHHKHMKKRRGEFGNRRRSDG
jgi:hypothetical protein